MSGYNGERAKVRDNIVALLRGGYVSVADESINSMRVEPLFDAELESVNVYTRDDVPDRKHKHDVNFERNLGVIIEVLARKTESVPKPEDRADVIMGLIEDRLLPNIHLQYPPPKNLQETDQGDPGEEIVDRIELGTITEGKLPDGLVDVFGLVMECSVTYNYETKQGIVTPFETADVKYDLEGSQLPDDQAHDNFNLPQ